VKYLLDTNIVSAMMRDPSGSIFVRIAEVGESEVFTSVIVLAELRFGVEKSGSKRLAIQLELVLAEMPVEPLAPPADRHYAALRVALERAGSPIGQNDMLIAAHAMALDATVVTDNEREFSRVPGLKIENWLRN
jgi:tRNA(fMet)-specific endonuclease VapC